MTKYICIAFSTLLLCSCAGRAVKKDLQRIMNATITLPVELEYASLGLSSLKPIKLVQYYGPEDCSLCQLRSLSNYLEINGLSASNPNFGLYIIISPPPAQYAEIEAELKHQDNSYNIMLDKTNSFFDANRQYLTHKSFYTFLLDKNNRVVLVGNPLAGESMWNLFKSTLDNLLAHDGVYVSESHELDSTLY